MNERGRGGGGRGEAAVAGAGARRGEAAVRTRPGLAAALLGRPGHLRRLSRKAGDTGARHPSRAQTRSAALTRVWLFSARFSEEETQPVLIRPTGGTVFLFR